MRIYDKVYKKNQSVKLTRDLVSDTGFLVKKGTLLSIKAADYEDDFPMYYLEYLMSLSGVQCKMYVWAYSDEFHLKQDYDDNNMAMKYMKED